MKRIGLTLTLLLAAAGFAHAASTSSIQTAERQSISIGDTVDEMQARIKASPLSVKSYSLQREDQKQAFAIDYTYEIENMQYVITVVNNQISSIQAENLNK